MTFWAQMLLFADDCQGGRLKFSSHEILSLLSEVCDNVLDPSNLEFHTADYKNYVEVLEWKLRRISILPPAPSNIDPDALASQRVLELFRLSTLIYLVRSSQDLINGPEKLRGWIESAFILMSQLDECQSPFPVLILGCEADTDERRMTWLELVSKTEMRAYSQDLEFVKGIVQAVWAQEDLAEGGLDYAHKLHVVFSSSDFVPALV